MCVLGWEEDEEDREKEGGRGRREKVDREEGDKEENIRSGVRCRLTMQGPPP